MPLPVLILYVRLFPISAPDFPLALTVSRISDQACRGKAVTVLNWGEAAWQNQGGPWASQVAINKRLCCKIVPQLN